MKLLGSLCIALATLALMAQRTAEERRYLHDLHYLAESLQLMAAELQSRLTPMDELCALLSRRCGGAAGEFFSSLGAAMAELGKTPFAELWLTCCRENLPLKAGDGRAAWEELGVVLGRYELAAQLTALEHCRETLERAESEANVDLPQRRKLTIGLGTSAGAFLILLLL